MSSDAFDDPRIEDLFHESLKLPVGERCAFLAGRCNGDRFLQEKVLRLLKAHDTRSPRSPTRVVEEAVRGLEGEGSPGPAALRSLSRPERLGRYTVRGVLGHGGMGVVYLAEQESPRRPVAIKVLRHSVLSADARRRFEAEARILGALRHPGIARILEAGTERTAEGDLLPFFAMELIEGQPLNLWIRDRSPNVPEKIELLIQVCEAVSHAQQRGVVHRDLKPGNILVEGAGQPKIVDFGIARALARDLTAEGTRTETGQLLGTPRYMSPEQLAGEVAVIDTRADVYALGVIAHEALTGRLPHDLDGKSIPERARILRETRAPRLGEIEPGLRGDLELVVARAIEPDPSRRYRSAEAFARDLENILENRPVSARPPGALYLARCYARRHKGLVGGLLGAAIALIAGLILSTTFAVREAAQRLVAEARRDEILRLADAKRIADYQEAARDFTRWPQTDDRLRAMEVWLRRAERLCASLPVHREDLRQLESHSGLTDEEAWRRDVLRDVVEGLSDFANETSGTAAAVRRRLLLARSFRDDWEAAIRSIADSTDCPEYRGLRLERLDGMVPLGRNPESHLWEFLQPFNDASPERAAGGGALEASRHGVVLVLIPGGSFSLGRLYERGWQNGDEHPPRQVTVDPFFIAKYEVSQAQWARVMGRNPSRRIEGQQHEGRPVDNVSWDEAREFCHRLGLELPSEAQWERAARGGTTTRYHLGDCVTTDQVNYNGGGPCPGRARGHSIAVDRMPPNPYGLHHVHGNVYEWCEDLFDSTFRAREAVTFRNPLCRRGRVDGRETTLRVLRGGSYASNSRYATSTVRKWQFPVKRDNTHGLRPARRLWEDHPAQLWLDRLRLEGRRLLDPTDRPESRLEDLRTWLEDADALGRRMRELEAILGRTRGLPGEDVDAGACRLRTVLPGLLEEHAAFIEPETGLRMRIELLREVTLDRDRIWAEAIDEIADPAVCAPYGGLRITPQYGMVPLKRDELTGLWVFAHVYALKIPRRTPGGRLDTHDLRLRETSTLRFVLLPGGTFVMGSGEEDAGATPAERPAHEVTLSPFFLSRFEVTLAQWKEITGRHPPRVHVGAQPVTNVSWQECLEFCERLGLDLPTEAQWEYACRARTTTRFNTGTQLSHDRASFAVKVDPGATGRPLREAPLAEVDAFPPNAFGLHNLHGNVSEWCRDSYREDFYLRPEASGLDPFWESETDNEGRVVRGGSHASRAAQCRSAARASAPSFNPETSRGFRPARPLYP